MKKSLLTTWLISIFMVFGAVGVWAQISTLPYSADFESAIAPFDAGEIVDATGWGKALRVSNTTATATFDESISALTENDEVTIQFNALHGWEGSNKTTKIALLNTDGEELISYTYDITKCQVVDVAIGGATVNGFAAFMGQANYNNNKSANGFTHSQHYVTTDGYTPVVKFVVSGSGLVSFNYAYTPAKQAALNKSFAATISGKKVDLGKIVITDNQSVADRCFGMDNLSITKETKVTYAYTINYVDESDNTIKTTEGRAEAGVQVAIDTESFWVESKKYKYVSDDSESKLISAEGENVITVNVVEAPKYNYSVKDNVGNTLAEGTAYEGEDIVYYVPYFVYKESVFYKSPTLSAGTLSYGQSTISAISADTNITVTYTEEDGTNVVFYAEAENLNGITLVDDQYTKIRMSNGKAGYFAEKTSFATLPVGRYTLQAATRSGTTTFFAGENEVLTLSSTGAVTDNTSEVFTLSRETNIYASKGSASVYFDFVIIRKTGEVTPEEAALLNAKADLQADINAAKALDTTGKEEGVEALNTAIGVAEAALAAAEATAESLGAAKLALAEAVEAFEMANAKSIFLKPCLWNADGARYAAYVWNANGNKWFDFAAAEEEGVYTVAIPESYTGLILARMNGATEENNWDNVWNQTADITFTEVTDSTLFTITGWNESDFETSKYEKAESVLNTYTATFTTNAGWEKVYAYVWTGEGQNKVLGEWPGTELTANEGVYNVTIEAETAPEFIIFNNGNGAQTANLVFENGKAYEFNVEDSELMAEAKALAADAEAVAVGKLLAAIEVAESTGDESNLQAAIDQFKADNAESAIDLTSKVGTAKDKWTGAGGTAGSVTTKAGTTTPLAELYSSAGAGTKMSQKIENLENGLYRVKVFATSHNARGEDGATLDGTATDVTYVFATSGEVTNKTWITASGVTPGFLDGEQTIPYTIEDIEVANGELTIGLTVDKEKQTGWHTIQIYSLEEIATAKAAYAAVKANMTAEIAAAKALTGEIGKEALNDAITTAEAALTSNMLNVTEFEAEVNKLQTAVVDFKKANAIIPEGTYYVLNAAFEEESYIAAGKNWGTRGIVNGEGLDLKFIYDVEKGTYTIDTNVDNNNNRHFLGSNLYLDSPVFEWTIEGEFVYTISAMVDGVKKYIGVDTDGNLALKTEATDDTQWAFIYADYLKNVRLEGLKAATAENGVDATFLLQNPNFNNHDKRVSAWSVSEDCTNKNLSGGANETHFNACAESFHSTFTISQAIKGAPAGVYKMTAQGFFRQDKNANDVDTVETAPVFFIGDQTAEVPAKTGTEDNMNQASESFTAGQYTIEPIEFVYNGEGDLVVGIKNETAKYQWIIFDNFQLTYYGAKAEEPVEIEKFYIMGTATTNEWNNTTEMTYNEETQAFEYTVENSDKLYVTFGDAEFTNWDDFNANHRYAIGSDNQDATIGEAMQLLKVNGTLVLAAGKYNISVTKSLLCTITKVEESSYNSNVTYALEEGDTFKSGQAVEVKNNDVVVATITYGEAGDGAEDFKAAKADGSVEGFAAFTEGNGVNGNKACGTFYTIVPNYDGEIAIAVVLNADKAFYVEEDGTALEAYNGIKVSEKYYGTYTFNVTANKAYKVYCAGSKLGFYGFNYKYNAEVTPEPEKIESMYIMGELTGGWDFTDSQKMTQDAENAAVWTLTVEGFEAEAKTYKYKATANAKWGVYELPASGDYTFTFGTEEFPAGKYNLLFTVNTTDGTLTLVPTKVVPDGINSIAADRMNGTIYNLNGQKVLKAQKGMYIINGKKVVKK